MHSFAFSYNTAFLPKKWKGSASHLFSPFYPKLLAYFVSLLFWG